MSPALVTTNNLKAPGWSKLCGHSGETWIRRRTGQPRARGPPRPFARPNQLVQVNVEAGAVDQAGLRRHVDDLADERLPTGTTAVVRHSKAMGEPSMRGLRTRMPAIASRFASSYSDSAVRQTVSPRLSRPR
jgi:hypothetical protein